ncbi:hypothetical protein E2C01_002529 [Portunus trituberculatus]|uniref:Uncharacterized protein n=1 Tax=Portunus trituberculatus TaxID=210409 RepID=A0A5B7CKL8_PORTR|nr:hypothetical protein [Portunus trituberculatus]
MRNIKRRKSTISAFFKLVARPSTSLIGPSTSSIKTGLSTSSDQFEGYDSLTSHSAGALPTSSATSADHSPVNPPSDVPVIRFWVKTSSPVCIHELLMIMHPHGPSNNLPNIRHQKVNLQSNFTSISVENKHVLDAIKKVRKCNERTLGLNVGVGGKVTTCPGLLCPVGLLNAEHITKTRKKNIQ